jgi:hypothetical protein
MPVNWNSAYYNMTHKRRVMAFIFIHEHFETHSLEPQNGTNVDCEHLKHTLFGFGF